jgi:CheY-like chemotaxis protein
MLRFFILEDDPDILSSLDLLLKTEFRGAETVTATTSKEAREKLEQALEDDQPFDAAILDCSIPYNSGGFAGIQYTAGEAFRDRSPQTILVHFTSYVDEVSIRTALIEKDLRFGSNRMFLQKRNNWPEELVLALHKALETKLEKEVQALNSRSGTGGSFGGLGRDAQAASGDATATANYSALCAKLEERWPILSEEFRQKIHTIFGTAMKDGNLHIGVAPDTSAAVDFTAQLPPPASSQL